MVKAEGKFPANARVDVDYSNGKPKIKFSYPKNGDSSKKQAIKQHQIGLHSIVLFAIVYIMFELFTGLYWLDSIEYPQNCSASFDENYINKSLYADINGYNFTSHLYKRWIDGMNVTCDNKTYYYWFKNDYSQMTTGFRSSYKNYIMSPLLLGGFVLSSLWIFGLIFCLSNKYITMFLIKQRWYQKWFPKHQAGGFRRSKKYIKFKPNDLDNLIAEIPLFGNVELDYKTYGDFSNKLVRIKIREHQYNKYKKGKVGKKKIELYKWYARFYFKEKPKDGYMEVIFQ